MIIPSYWAEARTQYRRSGKQITIRRFGWSETSQAEAETMARERAGAALQRVVAGEPLLRREPKVPYNGADGVPIREEVITRLGNAAVTRNSYGARCLNSPDVLFADVDFNPNLPASGRVGVAIGALMVWLVGTYMISLWTGVLAAGVFLLLASLLARWLRQKTAHTERQEQRVRDHVNTFVRQHPDWNVRLYRTPGGLRLLATHRTFTPNDAAVQAFFRAVGADPLYVRMCQNQQCFRARLTAKPWRIGLQIRMHPRPGVWPVAPDRLPQRTQWIAEYEQAAKAYAACRYWDSCGSGIIADSVKPVLAMHDRECRANDTALTLA